MKMEQFIQNLYTSAAPDENGRQPEFSSVDVVQQNDSKGPQVYRKSLHVVFCLDESGSMAGGPWKAVVDAYSKFLNIRKADQETNDLISVVQFASDKRVTVPLSYIEKAPLDLPFLSGGTMFCPALDQVSKEFAATPPTHDRLLLFMTDGDNGDGDQPPLAMLQAMYDKYRMAARLVFFGDEKSTGAARLKTMVPKDTSQRNKPEAKGCAFFNADTGEKLVSTFAAAANDKAQDVLTASIGKTIAEMISLKVAMDYL